MLVELCLGYPKALLRAIGHPVTWIGALIALLDRRLNVPNSGRTSGIIALLTLLVIVGSIAATIQHALLKLPHGLLITAIVGSCLIAQRGLYQHVRDVATALERDGLPAGRAAVAHIVGRDTETLDEAGVARAAIESLAESFSDGVVAPIFWMVLGGLPGAALYKAVNTADSMIGHHTERHEHFGWASARLDDLINLPASRLSALLLIAAAALSRSGAAAEAWRTVWFDAPRHRSPNAGYPEAAMAGALGLSLGGPRSYDGERIEDATIGSGRWDASAADIRRALMLYRRADAMLIGLVVALAALIVSAPL
jgi:adenosylcobinamide-phosphate synthase